MEIAILLATYNGEQFFSEQIESLLSQTFTDFKIYISDDFSTDSTVDLINSYVSKNQGKIIKISNSKRFGNARDNFFNLVQKVDADLYLFCDQDDVWLPEKVELLIKQYEKIPEKEVPILIHSDLYVVNKDLQVINDSFFNMMQLEKESTWRNLIVQNNVTGCTMLINKSLANIYKENVDIINQANILMHDHFFAILASLIGKVYFIDKPLIKYRQHGNNSVGAKDTKSFLYIISKLKKSKIETNLVTLSQRQVSEIIKLEEIKEKVDDKTLFTLINFSFLSKHMKLNRLAFILRNKILKNTFARRIYQFLNI